MKNISKTIASISLSVLAVAAMAQTPFKATPMSSHYSRGTAKVGPNLNQHRVAGAHKVSANQSFQLFYPGTDGAVQTAYSTSLGWFTDQLNMRFTKADTNALAGRENFNLIQSATVSFDTLEDGALNSYNMSTVYVDTLWVICVYKNTSGMNDTLQFNVDKVSPTTGLPTATVYQTINVPIYKGVTFTTNNGTLKLPGTTTDSLYTAIAIPATNLQLPPGVIHFAVNVTFLGSKLDTFELGYGFPLSTCPGGACNTYDYANPPTAVGHLYTDTRTINVNSYANGWLYYNATTTTYPDAQGCIFANFQANNYEWNVCPGTCTTDTMLFYEQDYAIAASITDYPTAISTVNANGLSVGQNYPNPFNKTTQITYSLTKSSDVTFSIYDMTGRVLVNNVYNNSGAGQHIINLDANSFSPGVYFYTFNVNGSTVTKKMVITE